jgi:hypothetical protein
LNSKPPVRAACRVFCSREIVCPLICKLMGKRDESHGAFRSGAATAVGCG